MGEQQVFGVIVWGLDEQTKRIKVKLPHIFSSKTDAVNFVKVNKDPSNPNIKWEIHTTIADIRESFSFTKDIVPNFK